MRMALHQLNDSLRTILVLRFYVGLPYEEIATILNISLDTARSRVNLAWETLRQKLQAYELDRATVPSEEHHP
jgi:RNA polymerase sigma factor (sigma-70 family)